MNTPLVTVTVCAYNCEDFIREALDSVLAQTYPHFELIIADDASKDGTKKIIEEYKAKDSRIKTYHNDSNMGYLRTWNKLIALAQGDFITFQDADDISSPVRLEKMLSEFQKDSELGMCASNYVGIDVDGKERYRTQVPLTHKEVMDAMPEHFHFHGTGVMIKKEVYQAVGGYSTFFDRMGAEDFYWIYLIMEKFKMKNIPDYLYYYRYNPNSVMGNLTSNSKKLFSLDILRLLIQQRRETGTDDLEKGNVDTLNKKMEEWTKPFESDKAFLFYKVAKRRFYEGHKKQAIQTMIDAIKLAPFRMAYYRDLIYFVKNKS